MKIPAIAITFFATGALLLGGCSTNAGNGAAIGSLIGAGIGKSTANHDDKRAVVGAVLGGIVGGAIGSEMDRASTVNTDPYYNKSVATTTPYSDEPVSSKESVRHTHKYSSGDRTHTHVGGAVKHTHTGHREYDDSDYVYAEPYPVRTTVVIGAGYYNYPRYYRYRPYRRHYRHRHYNRHRYRH